MARDKNSDSMPKEDFRSELDLVELLDQDTVEKSKAKVFPVIALIRGDKIDSKRPRDRSGASRTNAAASGPYPGAGRCQGPQKKKNPFRPWNVECNPVFVKQGKDQEGLQFGCFLDLERRNKVSCMEYVKVYSQDPAGALRMELVYLYGFCTCGFITGVICA